MCQTNERDLEDGNSLDIQPKMRVDMAMRKKAIYIDEALSKISKRYFQKSKQYKLCVE